MIKIKKPKPGYPLFRILIKKTLGKKAAEEYRFHPVRRWRFDFAVPELMIAIEIEGGIFGKARLGHSTGSGIKKDMEKYNMATLMGWKVLRYMPEQTGECMRDLEILKRSQPPELPRGKYL